MTKLIIYNVFEIFIFQYFDILFYNLINDDVRHDIVRLRSYITRSLESLMRRSEEAIQDQLVTLRNDRFVIPVRSDHRGRVGGVAHGFSSSGATVFVEPLETIDSNNELQALRETEEREIARILSTLTEELRRELPALEASAQRSPNSTSSARRPRSLARSTASNRNHRSGRARTRRSASSAARRKLARDGRRGRARLFRARRGTHP